MCLLNITTVRSQTIQQYRRIWHELQGKIYQQLCMAAPFARIKRNPVLTNHANSLYIMYILLFIEVYLKLNSPHFTKKSRFFNMQFPELTSCKRREFLPWHQTSWSCFPESICKECLRYYALVRVCLCCQYGCTCLAALDVTWLSACENLQWIKVLLYDVLYEL